VENEALIGLAGAGVVWSLVGVMAGQVAIPSLVVVIVVAVVV